jgi:hypothetical protein
MARTLGYNSAIRDDWHPDFREHWPPLVADAGRAIAAADPRAIRATRERLSALVAGIGRDGPAATQWPVYGALVINLRNTLDAMDEVAVANPLGQPPLPVDGLVRLGSRGRARLQSGAAGEADSGSDP